MQIDGVIQVATLVAAVVAAGAAILSARMAERSARRSELSKFNEMTMVAARAFCVSVVKEVDQQTIWLGRSVLHFEQWIARFNKADGASQHYKRDERILQALRTANDRWHDVLAQRFFWADAALNDALQNFDVAREGLVLELNDPTSQPKVAEARVRLDLAGKLVYKEVQRLFLDHQIVMINSLLNGRDRKNHLKALELKGNQ